MSKDELSCPTSVTDLSRFYSAGEMSLVIRGFAEVLGDLSPLPFPAARAPILSLRVLSAPRLRQDWLGTFAVLPAGAVSSC